MKNKVMIALALLVVVLAGMLAWKARESRDNALAWSNEKAAHDTTRAVVLRAKDSARILGDSLRAVERLAVQVQPLRDALDRATGRTTTTRIPVTVRVPERSGEATGVVRRITMSDTATRFATFADRKEPYTIAADVALPFAGAARMSWSVRTDSARVQLRIGCGKAERGVRPAITTAVGPEWLPLEIGRVEQAPEVCAGFAQRQKRKLRVGLGLGVGMAAVRRQSDGALMVGPGATLGLIFGWK